MDKKEFPGGRKVFESPVAMRAYYFKETKMTWTWPKHHRQRRMQTGL